MRLGGAIFLCAWVVQGCGGEEFASKSQGSGGTGTGGSAGAGGTTGGTGGTGGATGGSGGATGGGGGATGGTGGATGGSGGATGGSGGATGGTGGLPACSGGVCAPSVPGGWTGPIAIVDEAGKTAAACSGSYATEAFLAHNQLSGGAPAAQCGCSCDATGVQCSNVRIDAYVGGAGCTGASCCGGTACTTVTLGNGACVSAGTSLCSGVTHAQVKADVTKNCAPSLLTNLDNISWARTVRACAPAAQTSCATGTCVPQPAAPTTGRLCIYKDGNNSCEGAYTQKHTLWQTDDKRTCSGSCNCQPPVCGTLQAYGALNCAGTPVGNPPVPMACANSFAGSAVQSAKLTAATPSCTAFGSPTAGGEVQQDEVTICCIPSG